MASLLSASQLTMIVATPSTASMDPTTSIAMPNMSLNPSTTTTPTITSETNESSYDDELSAGAIAGIVIWIIVFLVIVVAGALAAYPHDKCGKSLYICIDHMYAFVYIQPVHMYICMYACICVYHNAYIVG